ncbi:MAG: hypothetical protein V2J62_13210 [candidate division KSB1 bacterium]|jgi:hypothetical protein|nr:hypothetical protein [candidate division KSB1 bacterium]
MGQREMVLLLGAIFFFSMSTFSVNRFFVTSNEIVMRSEFDYYGISLAQKFIEEAKTRAFDATIAFGTLNNVPGDFNSPYSLGHANNESYPNFNDVDDYHNLRINVDSGRTTYSVSAVVYYVNEYNPDQNVNYRTRLKKMVVTVSSPYMTSNVVMSHVFSYYELG